MYAVIAKCISVLHSLFSLLPKQNKVVFFSRQGKRGSLDFRMLAEKIQENRPDLKVEICATDPENIDKKAFAFSMPRMIYHAATARVCVLEGYIPAVSIPRLDSRTCVIQLWHALGAIKKFGYQSLDTDAGRSSEEARALGMHRNYDWIISAGPGAISAYAEAFGYEGRVIKPLGMPRMDYIRDSSAESPRMRKAYELRQMHSCLHDSRMRVLYAPTLRKGSTKGGWMTREVIRLAEVFPGEKFCLIVTGHPFEKGCDEEAFDRFPHVNFISDIASIDLLGCSDCVITDYSAIAFEAALAGKPLWFYVPDIEEYRRSPGLNIDPLVEFPNGAFCNPGDLAAAIMSESNGCEVFAKYAREYFEDVPGECTARLASFVEECYCRAFRNEKGDE